MHVRSPRPFDAQDGERLLSTEAWYTLNKLPGYVAPASGLYELEDGLLTGGAKFDTEHAGFSGSGFVSGFGTVGASVAVDVNAAQAGDYRLALRYANGPNPFDGPKKITLIVNGESRQITLPATGAWPNYQLFVDSVTLDAGANEIELRHAVGDDGHVNLDSLRLAPAGTTRYEAEAGTLAGGANVQTEHAGFSGAGYVGGYQNQGASTTVEVVALADAPAEVTFGYANGPHPAPGTKEVSLYVNGSFAKKLALPDHERVEPVLDADRDARAARRDQPDLDPLRRGRRRQREHRLRRPRAERADPVRAGHRARRRVRRRGDRPLPLDDDPQRGPGRLLLRRRQAADRGAGGRHRRHQRQRPQRAAAAGPGRRQLVGDDEGGDRRHGRLHPGRARRAREQRPVGQARRDAAAER